jgi:hypothetical protein
MALVAAERIERPPLLFGPRESAAELARGVGDGPTLDDTIVGAWEGLVTYAVVACPLCGGGMRRRPGSGAAAAGGRCGDCGTTLA